MFFDGFESCALTCTRSPCQRNAVYGVFLVFLELFADAVETEGGGRFDEELGDGWDFGIDCVCDHPEFLVLVSEVFEEGDPGGS